ncbi:hypothetical protein KSP39_PZI003432 [Platanthera zijinensis]|uniref:Uncharacterized protein n=1 Tax=Platanthera zijinensis TaxID=2320716 RepID=A0AAP0BYK2_9ASPA
MTACLLAHVSRGARLVRAGPQPSFSGDRPPPTILLTQPSFSGKLCPPLQGCRSASSRAHGVQEIWLQIGELGWRRFKPFCL